MSFVLVGNLVNSSVSRQKMKIKNCLSQCLDLNRIIILLTVSKAIKRQSL